MSVQKDFQGATDISSDTSVGTSEIQQMVNGLFPLSNIGLVYCSATSPDITNNPRFIRYIWMDITDPANPLFKRYVEDRTALVDDPDSWEEVGVADAGIINAMIADYAVSVLNSTGDNKIALKHNGSADASKSLYLLRVDTDGQYIEAVSLTDVLTAGSVPIIAIAKEGSAGYVLTRDNSANGASWQPINGASLGTIPIENLSLGTGGYFLRMNLGGTSAEWVDSADGSLFADGDIAIAKLALGLANQIIAVNAAGTAWEYKNPPIINKMTPQVSTNSLSVEGIGDIVFAHGLTGVPSLVRAVLINTSADAEWQVNDEVDIFSFYESSASDDDGRPIAAVGADATNIYVSINANANVLASQRATGTPAGIDETKWKIKVYAWL